MSDEHKRVFVEGVDLGTLLPFTRLFGSVRLAVRPGMLFVALMLIVTVMVGGRVLDGFAGMFGAKVYVGEIEAYRVRAAVSSGSVSGDEISEWRAERLVWTMKIAEAATRWLPVREEKTVAVVEDESVEAVAESEKAQKPIESESESKPKTVGGVLGDAEARIEAYFDERREQLEAAIERGEFASVDQGEARLWELRRERADRLAPLEGLRPRGVFEALLAYKLEKLGAIGAAAVAFDVGGVGEAAGDLFVTLPGWLFAAHPVYAVLLGVFVLVVYPFFCGALARMAVTGAVGGGGGGGVFDALGFSCGKYGAFFAAPLIPGLLILVGYVVLRVGGFVLFNLPLVDLIGGAIYGVALGIGLVLTVAMVGLVVGWGLLYPAIAAEGTDGFDAVSRMYNFVIWRPLNWVFYAGVAGVCGVVVYGVLAVGVGVVTDVTQSAVSAGVVAHDGERFDWMMAEKGAGDMAAGAEVVAREELSWSGRAAGAMARGWEGLFGLLLWAFGVSYFFAAHAWIYLLLRRDADGTAFDEIYEEAKG